jgi:hypothetical protein
VLNPSAQTNKQTKQCSNKQANPSKSVIPSEMPTVEK